MMLYYPALMAVGAGGLTWFRVASVRYTRGRRAKRRAETDGIIAWLKQMEGMSDR